MRIGEIAKHSGVSASRIRFYEARGLLPAAQRGDNGYRDYPPVAVARMRFVANTRDLGFSVEEISALPGVWDDRDRASSEVKAIALQHADGLALAETRHHPAWELTAAARELKEVV